MELLTNHLELKTAISDSEAMQSETDTEIIACPIADNYKKDRDLKAAVAKTMQLMRGGNAILVMASDNQDMLVAAENGSPLHLARTRTSILVSSDILAFEGLDSYNLHTLKNNQIAVMTKGDWEVSDIEEETSSYVDASLSVEDFPHHMLREIHEQPGILERVMSGRLLSGDGISKLAGVEGIAERLSQAGEFHFVGCGTAYFACMYAELLLRFFNIRARAWIASEFSSLFPVHDPSDAFIFVSQSGETADTHRALLEVMIKRNPRLGIVNNSGTKIFTDAGVGILIRAGKEIGVASTKAFTAQLVSIAMLAIFLARQRNMCCSKGSQIISELQLMPCMVRQVLSQSEYIKGLAKKYSSHSSSYFLGRGFNLVVAEEGALKLKEVTYKHAEAYPLGEMKHGPLAMVDEDFLCVVVIPNDSVKEKGMSNVHEIRARKGKVLAIMTAGEMVDPAFADDVIYVPYVPEYLSPILTTVPLQLFAYYMAVELGLNPDEPRNLAKSVTVE